MLTRLETERDAIAGLCRRFGVRSLAVFGSAVTDRFEPDRSDVDFLVEFDLGPDDSPFDAYFGLQEALEGLLGRPVDLVMPSAVRNPHTRESIARTRWNLYAA
jgi:predicted nucleotidyltransferase